MIGFSRRARRPDQVWRHCGMDCCGGRCAAYRPRERRRVSWHLRQAWRNWRRRRRIRRDIWISGPRSAAAPETEGDHDGLQLRG
jgi:hypothetical protein